MSNYDFTIIERAGIPSGVAAEVIGVSPATFYNWSRVEGRTTKPHPFMRGRIEKFLEKTKAALHEGILPVDHKIGVEELTDILKRV